MVPTFVMMILCFYDVVSTSVILSCVCPNLSYVIIINSCGSLRIGLSEGRNAEEVRLPIFESL